MSVSNRSSQMLKGILSGCILVLLSQDTLYGYTLSLELEKIGFNQIPKGTIYPLLLNLEKKGLIEGYRVPSPDGPSRKYYNLTEQGELEKEQFIEEWGHLKKNVDRLLNVDEKKG
ncbi:PadR family transcriptional regulator [Enterococcus sp. HY326]|uniref:PadR family transcriptional regulator n=1 Tax=Enterococcus sp. HY326 TaxID=2971265 RepID=UPI002240C937|nr:PadR family transcriptional regulator [Enterococcus sp. HY326]